MAMGGFDGSINIDTRIDSTGFNRGIKGINTGLDGITASLKKLAAVVGLAFGIGAIVNFGKASVRASTELSNALLGLQSILQGQGRNFKSAQAFIQSYISDGLIPATNAITAYKNLASRGYTDPQIQDTLQRLKDSAAFGRQASYSLGDAVTTATEGLKNENSILVDNAGVTKNVAKMWEDYAKSIGVSTNDLTKQQKIQAEYNGIMEETRFQVGDAAKLAGTYSGEVQQLGFNFNNLKVAVGNALIPMAQAALPGLNAIITALTRVANLFAQVTTALFGRQAAQQQNVANTAGNIAAKSNDAAKAQNKLADATKKAGKAADNNVASWDELNVLQQDTGSKTADQSTPDVSTGAGTGITAGQELGAGVTVSPAVQAAADTIKGILADIDKALGPTKEALAGLWTEFQRLGGFTWQGLLDFYNLFLVPVGKWVLGKGLPGFITAIKDGLSKVDWGKINTSLHGLWEALTPFAINVGEGLLWFWTNVLVPLGTWTMNNVVPLFLDILAAGIRVVNDVIIALEPLALWLFDNFLKPLAAWTGGIIVSVLTSISDALSGIADWASQNGEMVRGIIVGIGAAFVTWKTVQVLADLNNLIGAVGIAGTSLSDFGLAIKLIAEDRFPKLSGALIGGIKGIKDFATGIWNTITAAGEFIKTLALQAIGLVESAAKWAVDTAALIAHTVAQWAATAATTAWEAICGIATAATTAFSTAMTFLATNPIVLVVAAIAALIAIVVLLVTHWDQVKAAGAAAWGWIKNVWSVAGNWFNTNVVQPIGKFFTNLWAGVSGAAGQAWNNISAVWKTVSGWFRDYVISPIETAFKSSINFMIGLVEGFVNSFIDGVNGIINALNTISIDVPKNVPKIGGMKFGIDIPNVNRLSIPRLATGAVIPPHAEFAAILGDQSNGRNLEAPEGLLRNIVRQEVGDLLGSQGTPNFIVESKGDLGALISLLRLEIRREDNRIGPAFATGGGRF